jgi:hypothetical protein
MAFLGTLLKSALTALGETLRGWLRDTQAREDQKSLGRLEGANKAHEEVRDAEARANDVADPGRDGTLDSLRDNRF